MTPLVKAVSLRRLGLVSKTLSSTSIASGRGGGSSGSASRHGPLLGEAAGMRYPSWPPSSSSITTPGIRRLFSSSSSSHRSSSKTLTVLGETYETDDYTNIPPSMVSRLSLAPVLPYQPSHPLQLLRQEIESHLPLNEPRIPPSPVVSTHANFDQLGIPPDHPGRNPTDTYYLNRSTCLRTHTSVQQVPTFALGKRRWVLTADVYRRDEIDSSHYPIFHQMEGASIWSVGPDSSDFQPGGIVERECEQMEDRLGRAQIQIEDEVDVKDAGGWQEEHEVDPIRKRAAQLSLRHLKATLNGLALELFGDRHAADVAAAASASASSSTPRGSKDGSVTNDASNEPLRVRWISASFPFTSPSLEVEVWFRGQWLEILGCGIVQHRLLDRASVQDHVGWAFGLGLERIAMVLYSIPDIRLFWSNDSRFLNQFKPVDQIESGVRPPTPASPHAGVSPAGVKEIPQQTKAKKRNLVTFKPFSKFPACYKDISFWLPSSSSSSTSNHGIESTDSPASFHENNLMEIIRDTAGDLAEDVRLIDSFVHPKTGRQSRCYRIMYRSMERNLENEEVNVLHEKAVERVRDELGVEIR